MRRPLARFLTAYPVTVAALGLVGALGVIESGPLAIAQVLWVHLALTAVALVPMAMWLAESRGLRLGLLALALVFLVRTGGEWLSLPATAGAVPDGSAELRVLTWNVEVGSAPGPIVEALLAHDVDLIALQELTPEIAAGLAASPDLAARYPHRALEPRPGVAGAGLLSRLPLEGATYATAPVRQWATVVLDGGGRLEIANAHPFPARIARWGLDIPIGFEPATRNAELAVVRREVDVRIVAGRRVLLIGDFNTAPTEPAFSRLTGGLRDAHAEVGLGPGWTYRPNRFEALGIGLIRIDLVLGGPGVIPIAVGEDCSRPGDHCLLLATLRIEAGAGES